MKIEEFNLLIEAQQESQNLDFKSDCIWEPKSMAKDFIAMSNTRGGGTIIIGIGEDENGIPIRQGVSKENAKTYNSDKMRDNLNSYCSSSINFKVTVVEDEEAKIYIVIRIFEFDNTPIMAKTDIQGKLRDLTIYTRTAFGRSASAPLKNAKDFEDLIELAAQKLIIRRKYMGWSMKEEDTDRSLLFKRQDPPSKILRKIKSRGHWKIGLSAIGEHENIDLENCLNVVKQSKVNFYWDFPWIPRNTIENETGAPGDDCYEAESDRGDRKEFWMMFQNLDFEMYKSLVYDWRDIDDRRSSKKDNIPPKVIALNTSVYETFSVCFEFAKGLFNTGLYPNGLEVVIILPDARDRQLYIDSSNTLFRDPKITKSSEIVIRRTLAPIQLIDTIEVSNSAILEFLSKFGYKPTSDQVRVAQRKILESY